MLSNTMSRRLARQGTNALRSFRAAPITVPTQRLFQELATADSAAVASQMPPFGANFVPPQLNIFQQSFKPEYYDALSKIMKLRQKYLTERYIFIEGEEMVPLLRTLGASEEDFERLQVVSDRLYEDPTLPFRKSRNGRFCLDYDTKTLRRLEFQPFALSVEEDFKRYDSDTVRIFDEVENELQLNSAFQALLVFKGILINGVKTIHRPKLDYNQNKWVCTLFNLRTVTTPNMLGEPALEGVHTDGVDHTMTTYLGSNNMSADSAVTFMHDMKETTGAKFTETKAQHIRARVQHRHFLDTLALVDHERKHSISPVFAVDDTKNATRDMLIFFTRRPVTSDHISGSIDSLTPHKGLPMEVPIYVPPTTTS